MARRRLFLSLSLSLSHVSKKTRENPSEKRQKGGPPRARGVQPVVRFRGPDAPRRRAPRASPAPTRVSHSPREAAPLPPPPSVARSCTAPARRTDVKRSTERERERERDSPFGPQLFPCWHHPEALMRGVLAFSEEGGGLLIIVMSSFPEFFEALARRRLLARPQRSRRSPSSSTHSAVRGVRETAREDGAQHDREGGLRPTHRYRLCVHFVLDSYLRDVSSLIKGTIDGSNALEHRST